MSRRKAFTLVELLVVLSIIALLISILLPTISRVRQAVQSTVCLTQMRQIGLAAEIYAQDHSDWIPFARHTSGTGFGGYAHVDAPAWFVQLAPYVNLRIYDQYRLGGPNFGNWILDDIVYVCPAHPRDEINYSSGRPVSYAPVIYVATRAPVANSQHRGRLTNVVNPSERAWLTDSDQNFVMNAGQIIPGGLSYSVFHRHLESHANGLFFDGHARPIPYEEGHEARAGLAGTLFAPYR